MTFTLGSFLRFSQCGHRYWLQDVEGVQVLPRARQVVSQAVRRAVYFDLMTKVRTGALLSTKEASRSIESAARSISSSGVDFTPEEAAMGQSRAVDRIAFSAARMYMLWRAVVGPKVEPVALSQAFELPIAGHLITTTVDVVEAGLVRITKVRGAGRKLARPSTTWRPRSWRWGPARRRWRLTSSSTRRRWRSCGSAWRSVQNR